MQARANRQKSPRPPISPSPHPSHSRQVSRTDAPRLFRYLWVGAPNDRKGWRHLLAAWKAFAGDATCELYLKTTFAGEALPSGRFGNVIVDTRRLDDDALRDLYHSAHCFVLPSMGEGFGFTLGEAMATGLPCIYTPATSLADLCDPSCGYPIEYRMEPCFEMDAGDGRTVKLTAANPDVADLARCMRGVRKNYGEALRRGRRAATRIRRRFTWAASGRRLKDALNVIAEALDDVRPCPRRRAC